MALTGQPYFKVLPDNSACLYQKLGKFDKAEGLLIQALEIRKNALGENHPDYAQSLNNLAELYKEIGQYDIAEPFCLKAYQIREDVLGDHDPDFYVSMYNLAGLYFYQGKYEKAESLYLRHLQLSKEIFGEKSIDYALALNGLGSFYQAQGRLSQTEQFLLKSVQIRKEVLGENNLIYATSLNNLAILYQAQGKYDKAEPIYLQALQIKKEILGENHADYALILGNLAGLYVDQGLYDKAEPLRLNEIQITKETFGENNPMYSISLNNLAVLYSKQGKYDKAETLFIKANQLDKNLLGEKHPQFAISLNNLAIHYNDVGNYSKAEMFYRQSSAICIEQINNSFAYFSEIERESLWENKIGEFAGYKSFAYKYSKQQPSMSSFAYDNELFTKGVLLNTSRQIRQSILNSGDTDLIRSYQDIKKKRYRINFLESLPIDKQIGLQELEKEANELDKEMTKKSKSYSQMQAEMKVQWLDVQNQLNNNEAAIEFILFSYYNKRWTDSTMYCALLVKKGIEHPLIIPLCEQKQLDGLLDGGAAMPNTLYASRGVITDDNDQLTNSENLYNLIWKPIEKELQNIKTVYYSLSGSLNQIAFAALQLDTTTYLCDKYNLFQLSSTRQLATSAWQAKPGQISSTALFGGIKYVLANPEIVELQRSLPKNDLALSQGFTSDSKLRSKPIDSLPGTRQEVESISAMLHAKNIKTDLYTGIYANEETLKSLNNQNISVLHIATHGFFFPDENETPQDLDRMMLKGAQKIRSLSNPLSRSGLILAGGNRAWKGEESISAMEDGILTAQEISEMNLQNTELVVLSACETGLGDIKGGEGVFGLQRAFKLAGVKTIIMSLWKVPDGSTSEMMQLFYSKWLGGIDKHQAFRETQREMLNRYPTSPKDWAGFVMLD